MADADEIERRIQEREAKIQRLREAEERERRIASADRKEQMVQSARVGGIVLVSVLVLAGAAWGYVTINDSLEAKSCKFHEHATFQMYIDGELQRWNHGRFDLKGGMPMRGHMHQDDESQLHLENGCITVKQLFGSMDVTLRRDSITMDDVLHGGTTYREEGNQTLTYWLLHESDGEWKWDDYTSKILGHQLRNHQKLLILYGEYTEEQVKTLQDRVPDASGVIPEGHPGYRE